MKLSTHDRTLMGTVAGLCLILVSIPTARSAGSLSDLEIEYNELKVTAERVLGENKQLRDALAESAKTLADMRQNLAETNGEAAIFKRQAMQMKLRIDALGIDSVGGNYTKLEQRLLTAVNDLRVSNVERGRLSEALVRLAEAASFYARTSTGTTPQARLTLETEIREANMALGVPSSSAVEVLSIAPSVSDSMVISVKDDLALIVMNIGRRQGVKIGMPFQIVRNDRPIGRVRVVDVRDKIAGAVIQNLNSDKDRIKVGDRLKVDAQQ